jgi:hypothetical protein
MSGVTFRRRVRTGPDVEHPKANGDSEYAAGTIPDLDGRGNEGRSGR